MVYFIKTVIILVYFVVSNQVVNICNSCTIENSTKEVYGCNYPFTGNFDNVSKKLEFSCPKPHGPWFPQLFPASTTIFSK